MGEDDTTLAAASAEDNGTTSPTNGSDNDGLIIAPIQVIIPADLSDDDSEEEKEEKPREKKMKKKKQKQSKVDKTMVLTKTFGQALRLINEQKQREKHRAKQEEIRNMALEQKARREQGGRPGSAAVIIHIWNM